MVNTVGSCINKHEPHKWRDQKKGLSLSKRQKDLIVGTLLGDGTMRVGKGAINANFKVEQGLEQKEYVFWKYSILNNFVFTPPKISFRYDLNREAYPKSWWFRTVRHPELTDVYNDFYTTDKYRTGKKQIPDWIITNLNSFVAAVLIMDDGSYNKGCIDISTYCFNFSDIERLINAFALRLNVSFKYYKDREKGYRMFCNQRETKKLIASIHSYIIPSMEYKIGLC